MLSFHVFVATHPRRSLDSFSRPTSTPHHPYPKSHGITSFTDPHPLSSVLSYRFRNMAGEGHSRSTSVHYVVTSLPHLLASSSLSPVAATLMDLRASVANKRLTAGLSPLDATLTKNRGVPHFKPNIFLSPSASRRSDLQTSGCSSVSQNHPVYFLHLTDSPTQRTLLNSFGINPLCTLFIATEGVPPRNSRLGLEMEHPTRSELPTANCRQSTIQERGEMGTGARGAPVPEVGL